MGGGGGSSKKSSRGGTGSTGATILPTYGNMPDVMTFQPHFPGALDAITSQLMQGFGGDFSFGDLYRPMKLPIFNEPISSTQAALADKKKKYAAPNTGIPALDAVLKNTVTLPSDKDKK